MPGLTNIITGDFLSLDIDSLFRGNLGIIGNFPYHISSQIFLKYLSTETRLKKYAACFRRKLRKGYVPNWFKSLRHSECSC